MNDFVWLDLQHALADREDHLRTVNQIIATPPDRRRFNQAEFDAARLRQMAELPLCYCDDDDCEGC